MATTAQFTLGDAVLRLTADNKSLNKKLGDAERATKRRFGNIQKLATKLGRGMAVAGVAMVAPLIMFVKKAAEAEESESLFTVALGKNADEVRAWSEALRESLGLNAFEIRKNVGIFNTMFGSMGLGEKAALDMAKGLVVLSEDMASFFNLEPEIAFQKLQAGITGESEPLKRLGILVNETTVKAFAMANAIGTASTATETQARKVRLANITLKQGVIALKKSKKSAQLKALALEKLNLKYQNSIDAATKFKIELTEQDKVLARYGLILQQTGLAQGDLERTQDSATNQARRLKNEYKTMSIEIGQVFLPMAKEMIKTLVPIVKSIGEWVKENPKLTKTLGAIALAVGVGGALLVGLAAVAGAFSTLVTLVGGVAIAGSLMFGLVGLLALLETFTSPTGFDNFLTRAIDKSEFLKNKLDDLFAAIVKITESPISGIEDLLLEGLKSSPVGLLTGGVTSEFKRIFGSGGGGGNTTNNKVTNSFTINAGGQDPRIVANTIARTLKAQLA